MQFTTKQRMAFEKAVKEKYGEEVLKHPSTAWKEGELEKFREEDMTKDKERWFNYKEEVETTKLSDTVVIESRKTKAFEKDLACEMCGKGEIVFTKSDYFYVFKHECCEECYFLHKQ